MSWTRWRLLVDLVTFVSGTVLLWTGAMMWFVLPPGSRSSSVWTWTRHDFGEIHEKAALVIVAGIVIHLFLNWQWLMGMLHKIFHAAQSPTRRRRVMLGVSCFVIFFGLLVASLFIANNMKVISNEGRGRYRDGTSQVDKPDPVTTAYLEENH